MDSILLDKCDFCGKLNCVAHGKYYDRCDECGKRYARYSNYKCLQKKSYTQKRQNAIDAIIEEYKALKKQGFRVPRDIP